eukprot:3372951-Lingulodinium_polyedra.AAC.1
MELNRMCPNCRLEFFDNCLFPRGMQGPPQPVGAVGRVILATVHGGDLALNVCYAFKRGTFFSIQKT